MQQCPNCGHQNRPGVVFCDNCGASLIGNLPLDTKSLDSTSEEEKSQIGVGPSVLTDVQVQGAVEFKEGSSLRLEIEGSPEPILFKPKPETIFGRRDPATGAMPDIDLTPFAGYRMGVSRRHAAIRHGEDKSLDIWDLGSSNGTFLNGQRLSAHRPYRLHDGDELRLGQMTIHVYYQLPEPVLPKVDREAQAAPPPQPAAIPPEKAPAESLPPAPLTTPLDKMSGQPQEKPAEAAPAVKSEQEAPAPGAKPQNASEPVKPPDEKPQAANAKPAPLKDEQEHE